MADSYAIAESQGHLCTAGWVENQALKEYVVATNDDATPDFDWSMQGLEEPFVFVQLNHITSYRQSLTQPAAV